MAEEMIRLHQKLEIELWISNRIICSLHYIGRYSFYRINFNSKFKVNKVFFCFLGRFRGSPIKCKLQSLEMWFETCQSQIQYLQSTCSFILLYYSLNNFSS